jgi:uncharacterized membrane protein
MRAVADEPTPRIAPIGVEAPWGWLSAGWRDVWHKPLLSLGYGAAFTFGGLLITAGFWWVGLAALIPVACGAFMLIGPILAVGLYEMSRRYAAAEPFTLRDILFVRSAARLQLWYLGFALMFLILVWMQVAMWLFAIFTAGDYPPLGDFVDFLINTPTGLGLVILGTALGGVIAFTVFAISAISVPMLMVEDVDFWTAIMHSVTAVKRNPRPMLVWAWLIAWLVGFGLASFFVGLILVFPLVGHATWHAYEELSPRS